MKGSYELMGASSSLPTETERRMDCRNDGEQAKQSKESYELMGASSSLPTETERTMDCRNDGEQAKQSKTKQNKASRLGSCCITETIVC
jgi:hypothetical protein